MATGGHAALGAQASDHRLGADPGDGGPAYASIGTVSTLAIADSRDVLVLDAASGDEGYFAAIRRVAPDGWTLWLAVPPQAPGDDAWVGASVEGDQVIANSWSCYVVRLDLQSGAELSRTFTK